MSLQVQLHGLLLKLLMSTKSEVVAAVVKFALVCVGGVVVLMSFVLWVLVVLRVVSGVWRAPVGTLKTVVVVVVDDVVAPVVAVSYAAVAGVDSTDA